MNKKAKTIEYNYIFKNVDTGKKIFKEKPSMIIIISNNNHMLKIKMQIK